MNLLPAPLPQKAAAGGRSALEAPCQGAPRGPGLSLDGQGRPAAREATRGQSQLQSWKPASGLRGEPWGLQLRWTYEGIHASLPTRVSRWRTAGAWDTTTHPHGSSHTRVHVKALEGAPSTVSTQRLRGLCERWGEGPIVHLPQDFCPPGGRSLTGEPCHSPWGPSPCMPEAGGFSSPAPRDQHLPNCTSSSRLCCPARRPSQQPCKELALPPPPSLRMASGVTAEGRGNPLCADTLWAAGSNLA